MTNGRLTRLQPRRLALWLARCFGGLAVASWLGIGLASALMGDDPWLWGSTVLAVMWIIDMIGWGMSWRRPVAGGRLLASDGLVYMVFAGMTAGHNHLLASLVSGGPFLLAGCLFGVSTLNNGEEAK